MSVCFDEKWLAAHTQRTGLGIHENGKPTDTPTEKKRSKYGNEKVSDPERDFDSRHEAKVYADLRLTAQAGKIKGIARQVTFWLPGGVKYIADFVTFNSDGSFTVIDAKSEATAKNSTYRLKKKLMRECLGIEIQEEL